MLIFGNILFVLKKKKIIIILNKIRFHCKRQTLDEMPRLVRRSVAVDDLIFPRHVPTARS